MENATKALIIAASMLIAIMVISLGVYLFASMSTYTSSAQNKIETDRIMQFNNNFLKYDGRTDLTIHDIVTVANYARQRNEENEYYDDNGIGHDEGEYYVSVLYSPKKNVTFHIECSKINGNNDSTKFFNEKLKDDYIEVTDKDGTTKMELATYTCNVYVSKNTLMVYKVEFTRN